MKPNLKNKKINVKLVSHIEIDNINSFDYWNDKNIEKSKIKFIEMSKDLSFVKKTVQNNLYIHLNKILKSEKINNINNFLSLACGSSWLETLLINDLNIKKYIGLDFSKYRVHELSSETIKNNCINDIDVELIHGSFLNTKIDKESIDVLLLCQGFHHCDEPIRLLRECKRILKRDGVILIVGEHYYNYRKKIIRIIKHIIKFIINYKKYRFHRSFLPDYKQLFPRDFNKGDIHYSDYEYYEMFKLLDFDFNSYRFNKYKGYAIRKNK